MATSKNTLIYTRLIEFREDEFICKVAKTVEEARQLVENGFDFICAFDDAKLFRKRKQTNNSYLRKAWDSARGEDRS